MKRRLTLEIFLSIIGVVIITIVIWLAANVINVQGNLKLGDKFYGLRFSSNEIMEECISYIEIDNNKVIIDESKINKLKENNAWIQILDNKNEEVYNYNKPNKIPDFYTIGDYEKMSDKYWEAENSTLFSKGFEYEGDKYSIILGCNFGNIITKTYTYTKESIIFNIVLYSFGLIISAIVAYLFSIRLSRPINRVIEKIKALAQGNYIEVKMDKDGIYKSLNNNIYLLSDRLKIAEEERKLIENSRNEWISNIAHDLKTPLASIKGYSEILQNKKYDISMEERIEYSDIILNKVNYISELIEDLKLTYQLRTKEIPLKMENVDIVDLVRESVIDILNNPKYEEREINFNSNSEKIILNIDKHYMKRAINNLIYNAMVHNSNKTIIDINIKEEKNNKVLLEIKDNGNGISDVDLKNIFKRYYRGVNTGERYKGSGLGMAISKEIIEANNGVVNIKSELGNGTEIIIKL